MDAQRLFALSGLSGRTGCARRVQRQIHGQSDGAARLVAGDACRPFAQDLPKLLFSVGALAVQRLAAFANPTLNQRQTSAKTSPMSIPSAVRARRLIEPSNA